eukprot:UN05537
MNNNNSLNTYYFTTAPSVRSRVEDEEVCSRKQIRLNTYQLEPAHDVKLTSHRFIDHDDYWGTQQQQYQPSHSNFSIHNDSVMNQSNNSNSANDLLPCNTSLEIMPSSDWIINLDNICKKYTKTTRKINKIEKE